jgi:hypothetical protein
MIHDFDSAMVCSEINQTSKASDLVLSTYFCQYQKKSNMLEENFPAMTIYKETSPLHD